MLPTGYKLVEYIEGATGDANIDTGIIADGDLRILLDASAVDSETSGAYYAAGNQCGIQIDAGVCTAMYKGEQVTVEIAPTERHLFEQVGNIIYADGVKAVDFTTSSEADSAPLYIMPSGQSRIYSMRIYKADVLVRSYLPCVNPEGTAGFYDLVDGVFVTSESATFNTGADAAAVTFLDMDGSEIFVTAAALYGPARAPVPPAHDGYVFFAWSQSFDYIEADLTVSAIYRPIRNYLSAVIYSDDGGVGEIRSVLSCNLTQKLNGECTIDLSTLSNLCSFAATAYKLEILGLVFDIIGIDRSINNGVYVTTLHGEHISYRLNDYKISKLIYTGSAELCLAEILAGTPFSVGIVDFADVVSLKINRDSTKRDALMQLVGLCGGEVEYNGYTINIRDHVGSTTPISLMDAENVSNISMSVDMRNHTESYSIELFKRSTVALGDEVRIVFRPLGIDTARRITGIVWDPFNYRNVSVTIGDYQATISDSLYQMSEQMSTMEDSITEQIGDLESSLQADIDNLAKDVDSSLYAIKTRDKPYIAIKNDNWGLAELRPYFAKVSDYACNGGLPLMGSKGISVGGVDFSSYSNSGNGTARIYCASSVDGSSGDMFSASFSQCEMRVQGCKKDNGADSYTGFYLKCDEIKALDENYFEIISISHNWKIRFNFSNSGGFLEAYIISGDKKYKIPVEEITE